jgi:hypothetical protein
MFFVSAPLPFPLPDGERGHNCLPTPPSLLTTHYHSPALHFFIFSNFSIIKGIIYVIVQIPFFPSIIQEIQQRGGAGGAVSGGQACLDPQKL